MAFDAGLLDEFSCAFARALFAEYPDWVTFARVDTTEDGEAPDLVVEVPSSQPERDAPKLIVHTDDFEVVVNFDWYHNHFDWPADDSDGSPSPLAFIAELLNEDVAVVSGWKQDKWAGSWTIKKGEALAVPANISPIDRIRVRSWKGTLNHDLSFPGPEFVVGADLRISS